MGLECKLHARSSSEWRGSEVRESRVSVQRAAFEQVMHKAEFTTRRLCRVAGEGLLSMCDVEKRGDARVYARRGFHLLRSRRRSPSRMVAGDSGVAEIVV